MIESIELNSLDLCLEHTRFRNTAVEQTLLHSITQRGILDPLHVAGCAATHEYLLLDGFKRYRCARRLGMGMVPAECIAENLTSGILTVIRRSDSGSGLTTLEQAALIEELHKRSGLSIYDIAVQLGRSPSWVSMRLGMIDDLSPLVREKIMTGAFPARAYLYGLKGFTRVNKIPRDRVDTFVRAVSGKGLSTRELFVLSRTFFSGGSAIEGLVLEGDVHQAMRILTANLDESSGSQLTDLERFFLEDIKTVAVTMKNIMFLAGSICHTGAEINNHINFWSRRIQDCLREFSTTVKELHDRTRPAGCGTDSVSPGGKPQSHRASVTH